VRFAAVGTVNTLLDVTLFLMLHDGLGILAANFVSTSAGMTLSFVANGLFTFGAHRLTARHAALFVSTTGVTMWVAQPLAMHAALSVLDELWLAKLLAIGTCLVLNFAAYRLVVWPPPAAVSDAPARVAAARSPRPAPGSSPRACPARSCAGER
jgi:putative flippase GtrA